MTMGSGKFITFKMLLLAIWHLLMPGNQKLTVQSTTTSELTQYVCGLPGAASYLGAGKVMLAWAGQCRKQDRVVGG